VTTQCTGETRFAIPNIAAYAIGYVRVSDKVCLSKACGSAIQAIKALDLGECDFSSPKEGVLLAHMTVKLYA
jgi:hypothetical protein